MNVILLERTDFISTERVRFSGRRLAHLHNVLRAQVDDELIVGEVDGMLGTGRLTELSDHVAELDVRLDRTPPAPLPFKLILALPRPPSLRKVLSQASALGIKSIWLIHSRRVEKSFWQSSGLEPEALRKQLLLGLEQAGDTILPQITLQKRFKPFVEDELETIVGSGRLLLADGEAEHPCPGNLDEALTLVVGPEGGFIPYEIETLQAHGARPVSLGPRALRVETAVVALISRLSPLKLL
ncbi:MAG: 16S rRNA (uracil(1498)-N(3))-methyltransferase [bacterium]|nr:16S rRNA (uracil(1498)-N(3))-methyltransferase [bacterium]